MGITPQNNGGKRLAGLFAPAPAPASDESIPTIDEINRRVLTAHGVREAFPDKVLARAQASLKYPETGPRTDLRHLDFVTIDPADARDHDDAICALPDNGGGNPGGHIVYVAIADVAHYVRAGSLIDLEARERGLSHYLADRAVPMLPPVLSSGECSLLPGVDRRAVVKRIRIDANGERIGDAEIIRAAIRSRARLSYEQADQYIDGNTYALPDDIHGAFDRLEKAYAALNIAATGRPELCMQVPKITPRADASGRIETFDSTRGSASRDIVEKMMIAANAACADLLDRHGGLDVLYRAHDGAVESHIEPAETALRRLGIEAPGDWSTDSVNALLCRGRTPGEIDAIQDVVLSVISKSAYSLQPRFHYGLALESYLRITSPIRSYPDLVNQRALLVAAGLEPPSSCRMDVPPENLLRTMNARELFAEAVHDDLQQQYGLAWLMARTGQEIEAKILDTKENFITIGFHDCPYRHSEAAFGTGGAILAKWRRNATAEQCRSFKIPLHAADMKRGLTLGLETLKPAAARPCAPVCPPPNRIP